MGYYTDFKVSIDTDNEDVGEAFHAKLQEQSGYYFEENNFNSFQLDSAKWYESTQDLTLMSILFPNIMITVYGEGEESGDIWHARVLNGVYRQAKVKLILPDIDMSDVKMVDEVKQIK